MLGIARYFADPDRLQAEYAVAVRSDWKGRGVGYVLMRRLIEIARQYGIGELVGDVLRENEPMLAMCRELGFEIRADPNDAALVRVRKKLGLRRRVGLGPGGRSKSRSGGVESGGNSGGGCPMISVAWPATAAEIAAVCGRLDDGVVARILATGATASEVLEAFTWYSADDQIGTELRRHRRGAVGAVYDILVQEELDPDEFR